MSSEPKLTKVQIRQRVDGLRDVLEKHRVSYHVYDSPVISDEVYDSLMRELAELEKSFPEFDDMLSPTHRIGGDPIKKFIKVDHDVKQWSFDNVFSFDELREWEERNKTILLKKEIKNNPTYIAEMKIDGLKVILTYKDGKLVRGATRGNGEIGEDVTENIKTIRSIPLLLSKKISITVIGEVWMKKEDLICINIEREKEGLSVYANTRNLAAGTLRQLDSKIVSIRNLQFFAYDIEQSIKQKSDNEAGNFRDNVFNCKTQKEELESLERFGFLVNKSRKECKNLEDIQEFYDEWVNKRHGEDYGIDGLVVKVNERNLWESLGYTAKSPRGGVAYKFPAEEVTTKLKAITMQVGRTGAITPVAELVPTLIAGSIVSRATLHNADEIKRLDVRVGDTVILRKAGDVIPEIFAVIKELREKDSKPFVMTVTCPVCLTKLSKIQSGKDFSVALYCQNKNCPAQNIEGLVHFVSKKGMNIEGLGEKIIETLHDIGLITDAPSIYKLKKIDVEGLEGFGEKSAENIIASINSSRTVSMHRLIYSLGIRHVGEQTAKDIAKHFGTFEKLQEASIEELSNVEGVGEKVASAIISYFSDVDNKQMIEHLFSEITITNEKISSNERLFNKTFVITGVLPTLSREEAKELIEKNGGKVSSSVSKNTDYLLAGENAGSKYEDARKFEVKIIDEETLKTLIK